jgi:IstB-like ATP binding protein
MKALEKALLKLSESITIDDTLPPSPPVPTPPPCPVCCGRGMVGVNVPPGHAMFGRLIPCPNKACEAGQTVRIQRYSRMLSRSGLPDTYRSLSFDSFYDLPYEQKAGKELAAAACFVFASAGADSHYVSLSKSAALVTNDPSMVNRLPDDSKNWLVLQGGLGMGKTGLAAAVVNEILAHGMPVLFYRLQELFAEIQSRYGRTESPTADELIIEIQRADVLILDECNIPNVSADKSRLMEEIIRFRHGRSLPTIITCNVNQSGFAQMWGERSADVIYERAHWIVLTGQKLRRVGREIASF